MVHCLNHTNSAIYQCNKTLIQNPLKMSSIAVFFFLDFSFLDLEATRFNNLCLEADSGRLGNSELFEDLLIDSNFVLPIQGSIFEFFCGVFWSLARWMAFTIGNCFTAEGSSSLNSFFFLKSFLSIVSPISMTLVGSRINSLLKVHNRPIIAKNTMD